VDDEQTDRELIRDILQRAGHIVLEASTYYGAIETFDQHSRQVDLLVTDVAMPDQNGCDLAKHLLMKTPELGILFVSGFVGGEVCKHYGIPMSDLHFLSKPFLGRDLAARVGEIMNSPRKSPFEATEKPAVIRQAHS
jgi:two-component system, cell cycle sensor histidine kinase and response regulator CckA